jgi:biotin carboxylase
VKTKTLLIIGAGAEQVPAYELARSMGLCIAGTDMNPNAPAFALADYRILASTYDPHETLLSVREFCKSNEIHGVMTLASDVSMTVALVAEEFGLPGVSRETARLTTNKIVQIQALNCAGISMPEYRVVRSPEELNECIQEWGYPLVIKPPDNRGARGVLRITKSIDTTWAFTESMRFSGTGTILAEKFIGGYQISSETLVVNGKCYTAMYSGRNYEYLERFAPYIIENGGWLPAGISPEETHALDILIAGAAQTLAIDNGPMKGDLVLTPDGPVAIEFASRLGGGYAVSHSIPLCHGINLVEQVIRMSLGETLTEQNLFPKYIQSAALRFFFPEPGVIREIRGFNELDNLDWIVLKRLYCMPGDLVEPVTNHTRRTGCVIAVGKNKQEADQRARFAVDSVRIVTQ